MSATLAEPLAVNPTTSEPCVTKNQKSKARSYFQTDAGNAEMFADLNGSTLRFDYRRKQWLRWTGHVWVPDSDGYVMRLAKEAVRHRLRAATSIEDDSDRRRECNWAFTSEQTHAIKACLEQAKATQPLADSGENWNSNPYLLAVRNGVINLRTGQLRAGKADDRITMRSPVDFDHSARCERWEQFLKEIFGGDEELIGFVHRAVGYCLTGDTSEQCLFLAFGDGSNGKSTFLNIIGYILGDYAHNLPFSAFEIKKNSSIPNDVATLVGRRFVTAVETSESQRLNEARIKALTGGDRITARFLHAEYFTFQPAAKFWLAFNHKPRVTDDSHGFWRRIRLIPFTQTFDENSKDRQLESKLRSEAPGILAWAVRGCIEWQQQQHGLGMPRAVEDATREYRSENDVLAEFVDNCCVIDPTQSVSSADLFVAYGHWAKSQGESWSLTQRALTDRITKLEGIRSERIGKQRARGFAGIGLKNRQPEAP